jgi:hypothetical protein
VVVPQQAACSFDLAGTSLGANAARPEAAARRARVGSIRGHVRLLPNSYVGCIARGVQPHLAPRLGPAVLSPIMEKPIALVLVALGLACGGSEESECVPGDASRADVICSDGGQWVPRREQINTVQAPNRALCPELPAGTYVLRKTLASGTIDCPVIADEIIVVRSDGQRTTQANPAAETSCSDVVTVDGCTTTIERSCALEGCSGEYLIVLNGATRTGVGSFIATCPSFGALSCSYDMWLEGR